MNWIWYFSGMVTPFAAAVIFYHAFGMYWRIKWLYRDLQIRRGSEKAE